MLLGVKKTTALTNFQLHEPQGISTLFGILQLEQKRLILTMSQQDVKRSHFAGEHAQVQVG